MSLPAMAQEQIRIIGHRSPSVEYYAGAMQKALPEGRVNVELMPIDKEMELASITMSSKSDAVDVLYLTDLAQTLCRQWLARTARRALGEIQGRVQARRFPGIDHGSGQL
ncbi:hypothetical protein HED49_18415 [Ochrobactrum daejeonense]|nr:hypothetical protein [Brucella daejeonensis]